MYQNSQAGQRVGRVRSGIRNVLASTHGVIYGRGRIDATYAYDGKNTGYEDEIQAGTLMGRITASGIWVPCKRTTVASGGGAGVATCTLTNARAFKVGDTITIGGDAATIATINYSTNVITWTSGVQTIANADAVIGVGDLAGSETCRGVLDEFIKLKDLEDGVWRDKEFGKLIVAGHVQYDKVLGDLAAVRADTANELGQIIFTDETGQR